MGRIDRRGAKLRVVDRMRHGVTCRQALKLADVPLSERTAYRALKVVRTRGEEALAEGRHGYPYKLTVPVREWLVEYCRGAPGSSSRVVQAEIEERFGIARRARRIGLRVAIEQERTLRDGYGGSPAFGLPLAREIPGMPSPYPIGERLTTRSCSGRLPENAHSPAGTPSKHTGNHLLLRGRYHG